jgi:hypothetical protein
LATCHQLANVRYSGYGQFLSATDRAGRLIIFVVPRAGEFPTISLVRHRLLEKCGSTCDQFLSRFVCILQLRRAFYNAMVVFRDPEAQKRGVVVVGYFIGQGNGSRQSSDAIWKVPKLRQCVPMPIATIHIPTPNLKPPITSVSRIKAT